MQICLISDLHLEQPAPPEFQLEIPAQEDDLNTVLVIAGDAGVADSAYAFLVRMTRQFRAVIFVLGNNEHQHRDIHGTTAAIKEGIRQFAGQFPSNLFILDRDVVVLDHVAFVGATLWTDLNRAEVAAVEAARHQMVDYQRIYRDENGGLLTPEDTMRFHQQDLNYLAHTVVQQAAQGKVVVVITHHAPLLQSLAPQYAGDPTNPCFASDLSALPWLNHVRVWCHGHVHHSLDYRMPNEETQLYCNPRGKVGPYKVENPSFSPTFRFQL